MVGWQGSSQRGRGGGKISLMWAEKPQICFDLNKLKKPAQSTYHLQLQPPVAVKTKLASISEYFF